MVIPARGRHISTPRRIAIQLLAAAVAASTALVGAATPAAAQTASWPVEGEHTPSTFDCEHLYYSNYRSGMQFVNDSAGDATIDNTVITKRTGGGPPDYWSSNMALGKDPDTGRVAAFYSHYTSANRTLYKHVSGTDTVTDEIAGGATRELPAGANWGGITADPNTGMLFGAQNGGVPKLFGMDLASGDTTIWTRGDNLTPVPANDPVFLGGSIVPDLFVDDAGGAYYGISYGGSTYIYRLDPATGTTTQAVHVTGPGSSNGFNNYGMAYHHGSIYLGYLGGALYKVDPATGESVQVAGGNAQDNQVGRITSESGGTWPITDLASCSIAPNLTANLVVRKTASPSTAKPGDTVRYTVTVANKGDGPAPDARLTDDLSGVLDDATYNGDAATTTGGAPTPTQPSYDSAGKKLGWTGEIAPGATVTMTYSVTVKSPSTGDNRLRNVVTVPESNCAQPAKDRACSSEVPIAALKIAKQASPGKPGPGGVVTYTITATNDGQADWTGAELTDDLSDVVDDAAYNNDARARKADGAATGVVSYDAAGRKLRWTGDVPKGATVTITYTVTVGDPPAGNRRLVNRVTGPDGSNCGTGSTDPACGTDEPISGLVIRKSAAPTTAKPGDTVTYTITAENVGALTEPGVTLSDDLSGVVDDATYGNDAVARIGGATAPSQPSYDQGTTKLTWTGDVPAGQTVTITYTVKVNAPPRGDHVLRNAVTSPPGTNCADPTDPGCVTETEVAALEIKKSVDRADAKPGEKVTYTVTVRNTGEAPYPGASFTDDLSGVLDDATWNNDAVATSGTTSFDAGGQRFHWAGDVAKGATVTVTYSVTVGSPPAGDHRLRNAVTGPEGSPCPPGNTNPDCGTDTAIGELRLTKTASPGVAKPGEKVTYTVTAHNPGTGTYRGARFDDDLSGVLDDATYNNDASATGGSVGYQAPRLSWTGDVAAGATVTITYSVTVGSPPRGDKKLKNAVTGTGDTNCPPGGTDPACGTETKVAALEIKKAVDRTDAKPGEKVTYTLTVANIGTAKYPGASVSDDLSGVLDDAAYNNDAAATGGSVGYQAPKLSWTGDVDAGATVTITYSVTVDSPPQGDKKLKNAVTGTGDTNCPPGSADPACGTETGLGALEIKKTVDKADVKPGEKVTYTVTVRNTGEAPYPGASFTDDLSGVLDDATWNNDATATSGTTSFDGGAQRFHWTGDVAKGATVTVTYSVTVGSPPAGDHRLRNAVTGPEGSLCPPGNSNPDCGTDTSIGELRLTKTASPATAKPGEKVTYTVTAHNPGTGTYRGARFDDDLSGVLDDATYNNDATATGGAVTYTRPTLTWTHDLPAGATVTITYSVTVGTPPGGDHRLANVITGPPDSSCPPGSDRPECRPVTPIAQLTIKKAASPANPKPGDTVTYTVTAANSGTAKYTGASVTDDLSGVLDDATYNDDVRATAGSVAYQAPKLTWTGDVDAGATVTITYTVTVGSPPQGDKKLKNAVTGTGDTNCPPGSTDPACGTETPLPALKITKRGTPEEIKTGDRVTYTITVENTGEAPYPDASFTDDLSAVLDDATYNDDARADSGTVVFARPDLRWTGTLAKGAKATVTYSVTVTNAGDHRLANVVTGPGSNCPEGSTDPDCRVVLPKPHLRIVKTADPKSATPGGKVTYTVRVRNLGEAPATDASFTDDLTEVLDDATYRDDAKATGGSVTYDRPRLHWTGTVAAGAEVVVTYSVTVGQPPAGDKVLRNAVASPDDTNCPPPDARAERDPACGTETPVRAMTITKRAGAATAKPGDKVTYTVDVVNTGAEAYPDATFIDDLTDVLDDAVVNQDAKATDGTVEQSGARLIWHGPLAVGQTVTVTYSVTVKTGLTDERRLRNVVVSPNPGTNCVTSAEPGCGTDTRVVTPDQPPPVTPPGPGTPGTPPPLASTGTPLGDLFLGMLFLLLSGFALVVSARRRSRHG
ncbi:DUF7927 domain-containing protein [Amycolatopsis samaneae]|uniref:Internalin n=1 Tax=Amycolatopsis samaneae TaxID=664691 RepID=A0ABW5GL19_9PSEU